MCDGKGCTSTSTKPSPTSADRRKSCVKALDYMCVAKMKNVAVINLISLPVQLMHQIANFVGLEGLEQNRDNDEDNDASKIDAGDLSDELSYDDSIDKSN